jgi:hypothetical protein
MFSLNQVFSFLTINVPKANISDFIIQCVELGMKQEKYIQTGLDNTLPSFDKGHSFSFCTDNKSIAELEVLEKDSKILQAGIYLKYPLFEFISKSNKHFNIIETLSKQFYSDFMPMDMGTIKIINFGNASSIAYLSKSKVNNIKAIVFKVGNRELWPNKP